VEVISKDAMDMSEPDFDIAVIGGGPAGASAAITAARFGARVALLEAGEFPRHKVCGEFVSAESLDVLLDLLRATSGAKQLISAAPVIDSTRLLLGERIIETAVSPPALSFTRFALDSLLWQAARQAGVEARSNCEVRVIRGDGPFYLNISGGEVTAQAVVVAAGRWSRFKSRTTIANDPKWIGIKAHYRETTPPRSTDLYFFEHGYCGVQPVADDVVNACAMVRSDRATSLEDVFPLHPALAKRRRAWQAITGPVTTAPLLHLLPQPVRDNMMFVGDAAAFIDPFVGDGISMALRSGRLAAMDLRAFLDGNVSLGYALTAYEDHYIRQFVPLVAAAARIRGILSWSTLAQMFAFELLRLPGLMPYVIRKTRQAP
jgi:menaquinone-9 beta-reductase